MKTLTANINVNEEAGHLAAFIRLKWSPVADLPRIIDDIRAAAFQAARGWFDGHALWEETERLSDARVALLKPTLTPVARTFFEYHDALCTLLSSVGLDARNLSQACQNLDGDWNFAARARKLYLQLVDRHPDLDDTRPVCWAELEQTPLADDEDTALARADSQLFKGAQVEGALSAAFPIRLGPSWVMYEEENGRKASYSLVAAVYAHFLGIAKFLNTAKLVQDLSAALPQLHEPVVLFERNYTTSNPVLKAAFELAPASMGKEVYDSVLTGRKAFDALPQPEQDATKASNLDSIIDVLERSMKSDPAAQRAKEDAEDQRRFAALRAAFNS